MNEFLPQNAMHSISTKDLKKNVSYHLLATLRKR